MNWNQIEGNWEQFKGKIQSQWGKLTRDDLDVIKGTESNSPAGFRNATAGLRKRPNAK